MSQSTEIAFAQKGEVLLFEDFEHSGPMWTGEGNRRVSVPVRFERAFIQIPLIQLSLILLDAKTDAMIRYNLRAEAVTPEGFEIFFSTWADSKFARARVSWLAIGSAIRDEYWVDF